MKQLVLAFLLFIPSIVFCSDRVFDVAAYSTSSNYYGEAMRVDFFLNETKETPICTSDDKDFPVPQSEAIQSALKWTKTNFDSNKQWKVQEISLKFLELGTKHCVYVIQLQPGDDMQSLPIGVMMNGKIIPPVKKMGGN